MDAPCLYLAGPMTGIANYNRNAFYLASARLAAAGFRVMNPANHPDGLSMRQYLATDCQMLLACDGLALLHDWEQSLGATAERALALAVRMPIQSVAEWLENRP